MRCPHCESLEDKVLESRTMFNGDVIRRRRECLSCGYRFTSYERIEEKQFMVIKKDLANLSGLFYISSIIRKAIDSVSIISVNKPPRRAPKAA